MSLGGGGAFEAGTFVTAGRGLWRRVVRSFGSVEEARQAVEDLAEDPRVLEPWATRCLRSGMDAVDLGGDVSAVSTSREVRPFSFDEVPATMRDVAVRGMAIAYLADTMDER